jgi:lipoprotein-anchoring transpeptidase ErfK/SrfK
MDPKDNHDREVEGSAEPAPHAGDARPTPPPPPQVDPAEDPLYIDPDDPLHIPVPLDDAKGAEPRAEPDPVVEEMPPPEISDVAARPAPPPPEPDSQQQATTAAVADADSTGALTTEPSGPGTPAEESEAAGGRRHRTSFIVLAVVLGVALLGVAGMAYAGYDYSKKYEGRILPGATVAGVDIGGMAPEEALKAVKRAVRPQLTRTIDVTWEDRRWEVTPKELGAKSNARAAVDTALAASSATSFLEKTRLRVLGDELTFSGDVAISYPRTGARAFIEELASTLHREPRDAALDYSSGWVEITASRRGREVNTARSVASLRNALLTGASEAKLSVNISEPQVTEDAYDQVILVRIGENKLYLYQDGKITHDYLVATGQPAYPTPTGVYEITEKRYMPTWVNPAPDGWGSDMPASIPPGISNPLGLRALNWSASGIRFHGTTATYSLGYNASHGCVRMSNEDVIELYDLVEVGTPIVSLESAAYQPLIEESSRSQPTAENSAN